jgi:putative lipoic acid-binding regulatory protein
MKLSEKQTETFVEVSIIIAARKTEYFNALWAKLSEKEGTKKLAPEEKNKFKAAIMEIVSNMANDLFLSHTEKKNKKINPQLSLGDIQIDKELLKTAFNEIVKKQYPALFEDVDK